MGEILRCLGIIITPFAAAEDPSEIGAMTNRKSAKNFAEIVLIVFADAMNVQITASADAAGITTVTVIGIRFRRYSTAGPVRFPGKHNIISGHSPRFF